MPSKIKNKNVEYDEDINSFTESNEPSTRDIKNISDEEDEITDDMISQNAKKNYLETDFLEKIVKYVKIDDLIRKETADYRDKMATLKEEKIDMEKYILRYLDSVNEQMVNMSGNGKLLKTESIRKSSINKDIIKESIFEQLKKEKLVENDEKGRELVESTFQLMENKREIKKKVYLKRTFIKEKKTK